MARPPEIATSDLAGSAAIPEKPTLQLLRNLTDEHVLRAVLEHGQLTRSEIAALTGISKPTISESARRLSEAGVLVDTGQTTHGRGRVGSYYTLSSAAGTALVMSIRPGGIFAEAIDPFGGSLGETVVELDRSAANSDVTRALKKAARAVREPVTPFRLAVLSLADPVERSSGRLVQLPDAPFMVGQLDPVKALGRIVAGPVFVDNDVNWAARAERAAASSPLDHFTYIHLGEGLGSAVVSDADVIRGSGGVAGEIAHLITIGPGGEATYLTEVFAALGLRRKDSTAIDVDRLLQTLEVVQSNGQTTLVTLARALSGVVLSAIALADPDEIVLGGSWGIDARVVEALTVELNAAPRTVRVRRATVQDRADHLGARQHALSELRTLIARRSTAQAAGL